MLTLGLALAAAMVIGLMTARMLVKKPPRSLKLLLSVGTLAGLLVGVLLFGVALNLYTYDRLTGEIPVAEIQVYAQGPQKYLVRLGSPTGTARELILRGDEWQLDARFLKWKAWATLFGKDPLVKLERLAGRYRDVARERESPHSVHALADEPGIDIWSWSRKYGDWLPWVDTYYGSAVYMPLTDGARFRVSATPAGLLVRTANEPARSALGRWK